MRFATHLPASPGRTAHTTLFTELVTTLVAHEATFDTAQTAQFTTVVPVSIAFVAAFHTTFAVVETVHCTTAVPDSTTHPPDVAPATIFHNQFLRSSQTFLIHSMVFCHPSFNTSPHCPRADVIDSTHCDAAF